MVVESILYLWEVIKNKDIEILILHKNRYFPCPDREGKYSECRSQRITHKWIKRETMTRLKSFSSHKFRIKIS